VTSLEPGVQSGAVRERVIAHHPGIAGVADLVPAVHWWTDCAGVTYSNRGDLPDILAFINSF
jgi:hypothetical protein